MSWRLERLCARVLCAHPKIPGQGPCVGVTLRRSDERDTSLIHLDQPMRERAAQSAASTMASSAWFALSSDRGSDGPELIDANVLEGDPGLNSH